MTEHKIRHSAQSKAQDSVLHKVMHIIALIGLLIGARRNESSIKLSNRHADQSFGSKNGESANRFTG